METESVVGESSIPDAVRSAAIKRLSKTTNFVFTKTTIVLYEVEGTRDGNQVEFLCDPAGRRIELEIVDEDNEDDEDVDDN